MNISDLPAGLAPLFGWCALALGVLEGVLVQAARREAPAPVPAP